MRFNIPISPPKVDQLIDCLELRSDDRVVDIGCGRGEFLLRIAERQGVCGLGIDTDPSVITTATETALTRVPAGTCEFKVADAQNLPVADESLALAICLGSTHAFGMGEVAYPNALRELTRIVKPGGLLLIGEGYWKQEPAPEYLELIGDPVGIYRDHAGNVAFAEEQGLLPLYALTSNEDEWDHFEWSHRRAIEAQFAADPGDTTLQARVKNSRAWRDGYLEWGRTTMGFGFYLFEKPLHP